jgi:hypothetical protein
MHCPSVIEFTQRLQVHRKHPHAGFALESAAAQPGEIICRYVWQPSNQARKSDRPEDVRLRGIGPRCAWPSAGYGQRLSRLGPGIPGRS